MLLALEFFPLKLLPEDVSGLCHVLFFTLFCATFHAILVIAISLQTYGQEYFMNEEVSGIYNSTYFTFIWELQFEDLKILCTCYCRAYSKASKKDSVTANNLCYLLHPSDSVSSIVNALFLLCNVLLGPPKVKRGFSGPLTHRCRIPKAGLPVRSAGRLTQPPLPAFHHQIVSPCINRHLNRFQLISSASKISFCNDIPVD